MKKYLILAFALILVTLFYTRTVKAEPNSNSPLLSTETYDAFVESVNSTFQTLTTRLDSLEVEVDGLSSNTQAEPKDFVFFNKGVVSTPTYSEMVEANNYNSLTLNYLCRDAVAQFHIQTSPDGENWIAIAKPGCNN